MKNNLSRLTLVVPTYKRHEFATRLISYWADKGPAVIVLDGSPEPIAQDLLPSCSPNIRYIHKPVGLYERLLVSLDLITTDFVALACDDEFYIPSAAANCIKQLDQEPDLVGCCGRAIKFSYTNRLVVGKPQYPALANYEIDAASGEERLVQHMREYVPSLIYAICRRDFWKNSFQFMREYEFPFFAAGELQFEMLMSYAGKSKVIPELMWLRSHGETEPTRGTDPSLDPAKRMPDWWVNSENHIEHDKFLSIMSDGFSKLSDGEKGPCEYRSSVAKGVEAYLDFYRKRTNRKKRVYQRPARLARGLSQRLMPERYKTLVKSLLQRFRPKRDLSFTSLITAAESLEASGVHVDFDALKNIESVVREFHNSRTNRGAVERE